MVKRSNQQKIKSLSKRLTVATVANYMLLGTIIMLAVAVVFFINVVRGRYSDNVDIARTIKDTITSQVDISQLVDAVLLQERTDPDAFRAEMFVNDAADQEGQLLSYKWYNEDDPALAKREDYQFVADVMYAFNNNNKNLNGTSLMVFDRRTHIAALMCDVEKFGSDTATRLDYVMWRNFQDEDLIHIEEERWSLLKNLYRYMKVDASNVVFIWYEPVEYFDREVVVFVETDAFYTRILGNTLSFVGLSLLAILLVVIVMGNLYHRRMKVLVMDPIRTISNAAQRYVDDHLAGYRWKTHFADLNLNAGFEFDELARTMDKMEQDIDRFEDDITQATAERERIESELNVASRIQSDMLPKNFPLFPDRKEFDLYASMTPAKEIGGDFYDVFMMDEDHLCVVMADVSGKGIPAALFMVNAMKTIRARALAGGTPSQILFDVNNMLFEGNKEKMFVTVWLAVITLSTGEVTQANAGHENPVKKGSDGEFTYIRTKHSFVLGGKKNMKYSEDSFTLEKGDTIFIYTDGVTEATDLRGERFYTDRLIEALNEAAGDKPEEILTHVKQKIDEFVDGAPQFDDLTMLAVTYYGKED